MEIHVKILYCFAFCWFQLEFSLRQCREGARVVWSYIDRILGQPSLIRESSRGKYPWSGLFSRGISYLTSKGNNPGKSGGGFGDVILNPALHKRIEQLAAATANTKLHQAPFRNMLFYGPPGTGKTMAARELAKKSVWVYAFWLLSTILCWLTKLGLDFEGSCLDGFIWT